MDIHLQGQSKGIHYEGYQQEFRECIFEEGGVAGKNERYEFRCDVNLECCGRACCIPEEVVIPLWLIILFVILALAILAAILTYLAYLCAKRRKPKPKKDYSDTKYTTLVPDQNSHDGTRDARHLQKYLEQDPYSTPDNLYGGYGNRTYSSSSRDRYARDAARDAVRDVRDMTRYDPRSRYGGTYNTENSRRGYAPRRDSATVSSDGGSIVRHGVHETVEESFKQEITYERPASTDSREML